MSILGHPDYKKAARIFNKTVVNMDDDTLLFSYIILDVEFKFDSSIKYPCIPTRVDDNVDIYPLKGRSIITGPEYLVARSMGCKLFVKDGIMIPFKKKSSKEDREGYKRYIENKNIKVIKDSIYDDYSSLSQDGLFK